MEVEDEEGLITLVLNFPQTSFEYEEGMDSGYCVITNVSKNPKSSSLQ